MFPPLRFTIAAVIMAVIAVIVASVPFVSFRLTHHSLPYVSHPDVPQSLVDAGAGNFGARIIRTAIHAPALIETAEPGPVAFKRERAGPTAEATAISVAPPPAEPNAAADIKTTGTAELAEKVELAAGNAVIDPDAPSEKPPAVEKPAAKTLIETPTTTSLKTSTEQPGETQRETSEHGPVAAAETATAIAPAVEASAPLAASAPAAAKPPPKSAEIETAKPAAPKIKAAANTKAKKQRARKRRARSRRGGARRQASRNRPRGPFSLLFGLGR